MEEYRTLNIGCGKDNWGTDRIDLYKTPITTKVINVDISKLPYKNNTILWYILVKIKLFYIKVVVRMFP